MQDGVELLGQHGVDRGDVAIDRVAQRLRVDAQTRAAFSAEPHVDGIAGRRAEELSELVRQCGVATADEASRQHCIAHCGGGHIHGKIELVHCRVRPVSMQRRGASATSSWPAQTGHPRLCLM